MLLVRCVARLILQRGRLLPRSVGASLLVALSIVLAACGGSTTTTQVKALHEAASETIGTTPRACAATPRRGGTLEVGHDYDVANLNPLVPSNNGEILIQAEIFSGLVRVDPNGSSTLVPGLADSWSVSPNGLAWSFHLRSNARFSNGAPVTPADVQFSIDRFANPKTNPIFPSIGAEISSTQITGPSSVVIHLKTPQSALLQYLSLFPAFIMPKALVTKEGAAFYQHPVGSGPWAVSSFKPDQYINLKRNPYYWETGLPYLNELKYQFLTNDNTRLLALRSGGIDVAESVPFNMISTLSGTSIRVQANHTTRQEVIWLNNHAKPLNDPKVRLALSYAIDRPTLNHAVYAGLGVIPNSELPEVQYDDTTIPPLQYNPTEAKRLLAESSVPHGFSTTLYYPAGSTRIQQMLTFVQSDWSAIGVTVHLVSTDTATLQSRLMSEHYQMMVPEVVWSSDILTPDEFSEVFADPTKSGSTDGYFSGFKDLQIWHLTQEAGGGSNAVRVKLWPEVQRLYLKDMPWMSIMWVPEVTGIRPNVCDVRVNRLGWDLYEYAWLTS